MLRLMFILGAIVDGAIAVSWFHFWRNETYIVEYSGYSGLFLFIQKPKELTWPLAKIEL